MSEHEAVPVMFSEGQLTGLSGKELAVACDAVAEYLGVNEIHPHSRDLSEEMTEYLECLLLECAWRLS